MLVTVSMFYEELMDYRPELLQGEVEAFQYFRPIFHGIENGFTPENLYIGSASQLPDTPPETGCCFALVADTPLPERYRGLKQNTYLLLPDQQPPIDLFHLASEVFENQVIVGLLSAELLQSVLEKAELNTMLQRGYAVLKGPLALIDCRLTVLAQTEAVTTWEPTTESLLKLFERTHQQNPFVKKDGTIYAMEQDGNCILAGRISRNGSPIAYLLGEFPGHRISDRTDRLFRILCSYIELRMQDDTLYKSGAYLSENVLLHDLLHHTRPVDSLADWPNHGGIALRREKFVLAVEQRQNKGTDDQMYIVYLRLKPFLPLPYLLIEEGRLLLLCDSQDMCPFTEAQALGIEQTLERLDLIAVLSLPFSHLHQFAASCQQATRGLAVLHRTFPSRRLASYRSLIIDHMLLLYEEAESLEQCVPPSIWKLYQADQEKQTDLTQTLFAYAEYNFDMVETAKQLHIHYNTLKYRITRILDTTGMDLNSSEVRLMLLISKRIFRFLGL